MSDMSGSPVSPVEGENSLSEGDFEATQDQLSPGSPFDLDDLSDTGTSSSTASSNSAVKMYSSEHESTASLSEDETNGTASNIASPLSVRSGIAATSTSSMSFEPSSAPLISAGKSPSHSPKGIKRPSANRSTGQFSSRTRSQNLVRYTALYIIPAILALIASLMLHLNYQILAPLYNTYPLTLHSKEFFGFSTILSATIYSSFTRAISAKESISAGVCLCIIALAGDLSAVNGRRIGSIAGAALGPEWGAFLARVMMGSGAILGSTCFALLCFDHILPITPSASPDRQVFNLLQVSIRSATYVAHIYYCETIWSSIFSRFPLLSIQKPERVILCVSFFLTAAALFARPARSRTTLADDIKRKLFATVKISLRTRKQLDPFFDALPERILPILLLVRVPLLILALRQQIFLRPSPPYIIPDGSFRILSSQKSITGQIVVADNLQRGYRFLRCDASILGGKWMRQVTGSDDSSATQFGDSIFATFPMQDIGTLAHRSDPTDSLMRTISLTTDLEIVTEEDLEINSDEQAQSRGLIIGLGVGITAASYSARGIALDVVELDPLVYRAAVDHFDLSLPEDITAVNLIDGAIYISQLNAINIEMNDTLQKWSYVVHDCFTGGGIPGEMYSLGFWRELSGLVEVDGLVVVNVAGLWGGRPIAAIVRTLLEVFAQCRVFREPVKDQVDMVNIILVCTLSHSPLLSFRPATQTEIGRSPLRLHIFRYFLQYEIPIDMILNEEEANDSALILQEDQSDLQQWQRGTSFATWTMMQQLLSREMWMAW